MTALVQAGDDETSSMSPPAPGAFRWQPPSAQLLLRMAVTSDAEAWAGTFVAAASGAGQELGSEPEPAADDPQPTVANASASAEGAYASFLMEACSCGR